MTQTSR